LIPGKELSSFVASSPGVCVFFPEIFGRGLIEINTRLGSEAMEGVIKLARQVSISFSDFGSFLQRRLEYFIPVLV
jgi:hypothetical protein